MANILRPDKQEQVIKRLVEGSSVRSTERLTGVHRDTIIRLMVRVGNGCQRLLDEKMRNLKSSKIQIDEIWGYVGKKERHIKAEENIEQLGDMSLFTALDADTKVIPSFLVGKRTRENAETFLHDLSTRLDSRVPLSSDQLNAYVNAVWKAFGPGVDYGQIVKSYEAEPIGPDRYSPPKVVSVEKFGVWGNTSFVERQNLTCE